MNKLAEKIKNIFGRRKEPEAVESKRDRTFDKAMWGANDIARSMRESSRFQTQKSLWRRIFHF